MRTFEREFCRGVVETAKLFPISRIMAGLAGLFGGMRIGVTPRARLIAEMILAGSRRWGSRDMSGVSIVHVRQGFVALGAQYRRVCVDQGEFRFCMARKVECGGPERLLRVAQFTAIFVRCRPEFAAMWISMAIHADQLACLIRSFFACWLMTQLAFEFEMLAFQFESALLVRLARE